MVFTRQRLRKGAPGKSRKLMKSKYKSYKAKPKIYRKLDGIVHRFRESLRTKITVNNDTALAPFIDDPAGLQYRYIIGKLEDMINLTNSATTTGSGSGNNVWLNNIRQGGLKNIFDRIKIDYLVFKFYSPWTEMGIAAANGVNAHQATMLLHTFLDKDGVEIPALTTGSSNNIRSLQYIRERGNLKTTRMNGSRKVHKVICKPWTDYRTIGADNQPSVDISKPLGWFNIDKLYTGTNSGVPRMNLGVYYIECPTDILGTPNAPAFNGVIDCQITVYYRCKNVI